ncbi:hypothetical protein BVC80_8667g2 [Macleaya cordata]|uniref:Uncharacterized protein n=1 Tax=Macleaya cordata TaxID=56857 RepID=A0A200Q537_MACCD|nr:hypothetical protein BVC80_8667g2 [Macleaya cordata]
MTEFNSEGSKPWNAYTSANPSPSQTGGGGGGGDRDAAPWRNFGSSLNAISFGFVATAILVSMFIIMAIFEHLIRPRPAFSSPQDAGEGSLELGQMRVRIHTLEKLSNSQPVSTSYTSDFSVLMPGEHCPTFIAQPAPLPNCPREGIYWPSHGHAFVSP